jgi:hypothetical protein
MSLIARTIYAITLVASSQTTVAVPEHDRVLTLCEVMRQLKELDGALMACRI